MRINRGRGVVPSRAHTTNDADIMSEEGWKRFGLIRGPGLPAPTGQYTVGCVDLMHKLEGDNDGLLVRLFYPTIPQLQEGAGYQYARWMPDKRYVEGSLAFKRSRFPGFISSVTSLILDPRVPALEGVPLYHHNAKHTRTSNPPDVTETESAQGESGGEVKSKVEQWKADQSSAEVLMTTKPFPVVVFSHGLSGMRTLYCGMCSDLASHGFVVAALEHRDGSGAVVLKRVPKPGGPEGQLVDEWMEYQRPESERNADFDPQNLQDVPLRHEQVKKRSFDAKQALNLLNLLNKGGNIHNMLKHSRDYDFGQFKSRLDVETATIMGHSFGGSTTVLTLREDKRFRCGIALDAWMVPFPPDFLEGLSIAQPLLFINSYSWQWKENVQSMLKLIQSSKMQGNNNCSIITLKDTDHYDQTDLRFVLPGFALRKLRESETSIDPLVAHQINLQLCRAFLKRHLLKGCEQSVPELDGGEGCSEYIIHGTNVDFSTSPSEADVSSIAEQQGTESPVKGGNDKQ